MTKTFTIERMTKTLLKMLTSNLLTVNASKIGRNRRGKLLMSSFTAMRSDDGKLVVTLTWKQRGVFTPNMIRDAVTRYRLQVFNFCDHKLLLKKLGSA